MSLDWLFERFSPAGEKEAVIFHDRPYAYAWLLQQVDEWKRELDSRGVLTGSVVAIEGDYSPRVIALLLALVDRGCIVVPLTSTVEALKPRFMEIAEVQKSFRFLSEDQWVVDEKQRQPSHAFL